MEQQIQQQNQIEKGRKSVLLLVLLLLLVTLTVGFAVLSTTLNINGKSKIVNPEWCVGPKCSETCANIETCSNPPITCPAGENCIIVDCDVNENNKCNCDPVTNVCEGPAPIDCDATPALCDCTGSTCIPHPQIWMKGNDIDFRHTLVKPTDTFTFNVRYDNGGDIDAKIAAVHKSPLNTTAQSFLTYDVTYSEGATISAGQSLNAGDSHNYKVVVSYNDVSALPTPEQLAAINEDGNGATSHFDVTFEQK